MWRARRGGPRTPSRTTDANLDGAFVENPLLILVPKSARHYICITIPVVLVDCLAIEGSGLAIDKSTSLSTRTKSENLDAFLELVTS